MQYPAVRTSILLLTCIVTVHRCSTTHFKAPTSHPQTFHLHNNHTTHLVTLYVYTHICVKRGRLTKKALRLKVSSVDSVYGINTCHFKPNLRLAVNSKKGRISVPVANAESARVLPRTATAPSPAPQPNGRGYPRGMCARADRLLALHRHRATH